MSSDKARTRWLTVGESRVPVSVPRLLTRGIATLSTTVFVVQPGPVSHLYPRFLRRWYLLLPASLTIVVPPLLGYGRVIRLP